jgi:hypothetical protein
MANRRVAVILENKRFQPKGEARSFHAAAEGRAPGALTRAQIEAMNAHLKGLKHGREGYFTGENLEAVLRAGGIPFTRYETDTDDVFSTHAAADRQLIDDCALLLKALDDQTFLRAQADTQGPFRKAREALRGCFARKLWRAAQPDGLSVPV